MNRTRDRAWWWWLFTGVALGAHLAGWGAGLAVALVLTAVDGIARALAARSPIAFAVQVRAAYLLLLVLGSWPPLALLHWMQLAGTASLLVFDYCPLARTLSLFPWNRRAPLTLARVRATFFSPPVRGSILQALDPPRGG